MKKLLSVFLFTFICTVAVAQSLWIQVNPIATKGKSQKVEVYFGERGQKFPLKEWDASMKQLDLQLISPDGSIQNLKTKVAGEDGLMAHFTPRQEGVYALRVVHTLPQVEHARKTTFMATAFVELLPFASLQQLKAGVEELHFALNLYGNVLSSAYELKCKHGEENLSQMSIEVFDQENKIFKQESDEEGMFRVMPETSGTYQCTLNFLDHTPGTYRGQNYSNHQWVNTLQLVIP